MTSAVNIGRTSLRLADIVQQHRHPQKRFRLDYANRVSYMSVNVIAVMRSMLLKVKAWCYLGNNPGNNIAVIV